MAAKPSVCLSLTFIIMIASTVTARVLTEPEGLASSSTASLVSRLKLDEETGYCWDSLVQLQHCSGELIMFFLNGETYIGPGCCHAIRTVGRKCWPTMMGVIGFTAQEGDMLLGYCDENDQDDDGSDHSPPPSPALIPSKISKPVNVISSNP